MDNKELDEEIRKAQQAYDNAIHDASMRGSMSPWLEAQAEASILEYLKGQKK